MAIKYTSTKIKKEKPAKAPKAQKPEKPLKGETSFKVKICKPSKIKTAKAPKAEKTKTNKPNIQIRSSKTKGDVTISGLKKTSSRSNLIRTPKSVNIKLVVIAAIAAIILIALAVVIIYTPDDDSIQVKNISFIFIASTPNKQKYYVGEEADFEGLRITAVYQDGKTASIPYSECTITGFDTSIPAEKQTITVKYQNFDATFSIIVKELPKPTPVLVRIYFQKLPKTEYTFGERLDTSGGMLVREYKDGSTMTITLVNNYIYGWKAAKEAYEAGIEGPYTLTVKYKENGILAETTYEITFKSTEESSETVEVE